MNSLSSSGPEAANEIRQLWKGWTLKYKYKYKYKYKRDANLEKGVSKYTHMLHFQTITLSKHFKTGHKQTKK